MRRAISIVRKGQNLFHFLKQEKKRSQGLLSALKNLSKGFFSVSEVIYDFPNNNAENYLSDWNRVYKGPTINGPQRVILDDKILFHSVEANNPSVLPIIFYISKRKIWKKTGSTTFTNCDFESFMNEIKRYKNGLIIKPSTGGGGNGITKIKYSAGGYIFKGDCENQEDLMEMFSNNRDYIITEVLKQSGMLSEIYSHSLNTMRILVMKDPTSGKPFIARVVQRLGTKQSGIVDNWSAGGISIDVDISTGRMGRGARLTKSGSLQWVTVHPDTGVEFYGTKIPNWEKILIEVMEISERYYFLPYIGWDVVPMNKGVHILEGNTNSDVNLIQIHGGLLEDKRIKEFYKSHRVVIDQN